MADRTLSPRTVVEFEVM